MMEKMQAADVGGLFAGDSPKNHAASMLVDLTGIAATASSCVDTCKWIGA